MSTLLYNPDKKDRQELIDEFVVRTDIFSRIFSDLESGAMKHPEQHYLLLGQRGSGKTTLLTRLRYAVEDSPKLNSWLIPIAFSEEQYNISELANVWENIAAYLEDYDDFDGLTENIQTYVDKSGFESIALDILLTELDKRKKKIILFIDNLGDMLAKFSEIEVRRFREILQTKSQIRLIAGSAIVLESILDYQQPLFEFFKVIQLKGLTNEETRTLLRKLAVLYGESNKIEGIIANAPSRIETLRTLSGGVPRTMVLLFHVFIDNEHGNAISDLDKLLDAVTPLYKHRMDDLPTQQQKIVDAVARNWDAISVKELKDRLRLESKTISSQLRQLEKNMVVEKRQTNTKNHIYLIRERFFNIWYLMRYGRKQDRQRVIWLVKFLEMWCDNNEMENRVMMYVRQAQTGKLSKRKLEFYGEVYSFFSKISPELKLNLKNTVPRYISSQIELSDHEFDSLINKYYNEKNWEAFITTATCKVHYSSKEKEMVFALLGKLEEMSDVENVFKDNFLKFRDFDNSQDSKVPYFYLGYSLFSSMRLASKIIYTDVSIESEEFLVALIEIFEIAFADGNDSTWEADLLFDFLLILLMAKRYNLIKSAFDKLLNDEISNKLKLIYHTANYMESGRNYKTLERLGSELQEKVVSISNKIEESDKKISEIIHS